MRCGYQLHAYAASLTKGKNGPAILLPAASLPADGYDQDEKERWTHRRESAGAEDEQVEDHGAKHGASDERGSESRCPRNQKQRAPGYLDDAREIPEPLAETDFLEQFHPGVARQLFHADQEEHEGDGASQHPIARG